MLSCVCGVWMEDTGKCVVPVICWLVTRADGLSACIPRVCNQQTEWQGVLGRG
jgi:hypothetical protein